MTHATCRDGMQLTPFPLPPSRPPPFLTIHYLANSACSLFPIFPLPFSVWPAILPRQSAFGSSFLFLFFFTSPKPLCSLPPLLSLSPPEIEIFLFCIKNTNFLCIHCFALFLPPFIRLLHFLSFSPSPFVPILPPFSAPPFTFRIAFPSSLTRDWAFIILLRLYTPLSAFISLPFLHSVSTLVKSRFALLLSPRLQLPSLSLFTLMHYSLPFLFGLYSFPVSHSSPGLPFCLSLPSSIPYPFFVN